MWQPNKWLTEWLTEQTITPIKGQSDPSWDLVRVWVWAWVWVLVEQSGSIFSSSSRSISIWTELSIDELWLVAAYFIKYENTNHLSSFNIHLKLRSESNKVFFIKYENTNNLSSFNMHLKLGSESNKVFIEL